MTEEELHMFCFKCGAQLPDGAGFCSSCGASLNGGASSPQAPVMDYQAQMQMQQMQAQQYQMQKNSIRQSEIASLSHCYDHFNLKRETFQEYDKVGARVNYYARGAKSALIVWGAIICAFNLFILMGFAASEPPASLVFMCLIGLLAGGAMIFGGVMMKVKNKKNRALVESEYVRLAQELNDHYNAYPNCPVGAEYANPEILELIMNTLNSGRADTIKEAINVLIAEVNQAEMQAYLQNIEAYSRSAASASRTGAVFAAASFFLK